jgi:fatty acid desaturase 2 (delta-6 desaturase)
VTSTGTLRFGDVEYDVTHFKHPGGSVIFYMLANTGADATEAFNEFHMRSPKAWKMLKAGLYSC